MSDLKKADSDAALSPQNPPGSAPAWLFLLCALEFWLAGWMITRGFPGSEVVFLWGLSLSRFLLTLLTVLLGIGFLFLAWRQARAQLHSRFLASAQQNKERWDAWALATALVAVLIALSPATWLGVYGGYYQRFRPLLVVLGLLPFQFYLAWSADGLFQARNFPRRASLFSLAVLAITGVFIYVTRLGITPDSYYWNVSGMPLSSFQLVAALLAAVALTMLLRRLRLLSRTTRSISGDLVICLFLFLLAFGLWGFAPMNRHYFSLQPQKPFLQPYPYSDARVHDLGALAIVNGWGINNGAYSDKPLYMVFLSILHVFAGVDYNLLALLQIAVLALIGPLLYGFGKAIHNRFLGLLLALVIIIRQYNAVLLSTEIASVNPRLLASELPVLLGLIGFTWLVFTWLKFHGARWQAALAAGGVLGAISLIRMNPVFLLPFIPVFLLVVYWRNPKRWIAQSAVFVLGFSLVITPWLATGQDELGRPFFFIKFFDVINTRYNTGQGAAPVPSKLVVSDPLQGIILASGGASFDEIARLQQAYDSFPMFIPNHFLHNLFGAVQALPDSLSTADQDLLSLAARPYWDETRRMEWQGDIPLARIPFYLINMALLAWGIGWCWSRWRWAGLFPLYLFLVYSLSLGFARNSGSRYLVPGDWVIFLYYGVGLVSALGALPAALRRKMFIDPAVDPDAGQAGMAARASLKWLWLIAALLLLGLTVPVADNLVPERSGLCPAETHTVDALEMLGVQANETMHYLAGEMLYPRYSKEDLDFILVSCRQMIPVSVPKSLLADVILTRSSSRSVVIGWPKDVATLEDIRFFFVDR